MSFKPIVEAQFPAAVLAADRPVLVGFHAPGIEPSAAEVKLWSGLSVAFGRLVLAYGLNVAEAHRTAWRYGCGDGMVALFYAGALYDRAYLAEISEPNSWMNTALDAVLERRPLDDGPLGFDAGTADPPEEPEYVPQDEEVFDPPELRVARDYAEFTALDEASYRAMLEMQPGAAAVLFFEENSLPAAAMMPNLRACAAERQLPVFTVDKAAAPQLAARYALPAEPFLLFLQDGVAVDGKAGPQYFTLGRWLDEVTALAPVLAQAADRRQDALVLPVAKVLERAQRQRRGR